MSDDEAAVYEFFIQLHRPERRRRDVQPALALFGERGVVDLIGVSGYYAAVSMTLNDAQVMPPKALRCRSISSGARLRPTPARQSSPYLRGRHAMKRTSHQRPPEGKLAARPLLDRVDAVG